MAFRVGSKVRIKKPAPSQYIGLCGEIVYFSDRETVLSIEEQYADGKVRFFRATFYEHELEEIEDHIDLPAGQFRCGCTAITSNMSHKCCDCRGVMPKIVMHYIINGDKHI